MKTTNKEKTVHNKIKLRTPTNFIRAKERKEYQDNERPKNKPSSRFYKYGVDGVRRGDDVVGHQSGSRGKKTYSRILRKKINKETSKIIKESLSE